MSRVIREPLPELRSAECFEDAFYEVENLVTPIAKVPAAVMSELLGKDSVLLGLGLPGQGSAIHLDIAAFKSPWLEGKGMRAYSYTTKLWFPLKWHTDSFAVLHLQGKVYGAEKRSVQAALVEGIEEGEFEDWRSDFCVDLPIDFVLEEPFSPSGQETDMELGKSIYTGEVKTGDGLIIGGQGFSSSTEKAVAAAHCFGGAGEWAILYSNETIV